MSNLSVQLTAPNGRSYAQPIGLFINNEFVASKSGEKITSINPSYVCRLLSFVARLSHEAGNPQLPLNPELNS